MASERAWVLGGEPVTLLGDRALHWPARGRLLLSDLHLGKADVFRRAGIGLPAGGTDLDLQRLGALVASTAAREVWILGDVLHGPAPDAAWRRTWDAWRAEWPELRIVAVAGNHDRALAGAGLGIELVGDAIEDGPFLLRHEPREHVHLHVICGHVHPSLAVPGLPRRWPAFWLQARGVTILPAFSQFTGGVVPELAVGDRVVACADGELIEVPAGVLARRR